ncbi:interferon-induced protein 44-like isoform X6 [Hippoglossus stenolepis]|uniref:interferon-induced protein 44-like isoform X6 n=1 Tax=Hippoglossus stenolepis TaxID=195615 RepID=UPI001FAE8F82|nr:interferon-induced protein 44-like isoform X6 [Hippoglossus stenolepis]
MSYKSECQEPQTERKGLKGKHLCSFFLLESLCPEPHKQSNGRSSFSASSFSVSSFTTLGAAMEGGVKFKHLRILLHGPVGAGKSSFINSVDSVLKGRPASRALTDGISGSSFTRKYRTFKFHKNPESTYSFVFNDIMGFEKDSDRGVPVEDVKLALRGHVKEGYKFNPKEKLMEGADGYKLGRTLEDKVHVLVCVVRADTVSVLSDEMVKKMKEVRLAASELGIPQLAILTRVDEACPEVKKDSSNIYKSRYLKEKVEEFHHLLGIPMNCIFLVKNYCDEIESNDKINAAIVCVLKQMLYFGEDFLEK